MSQLYLIAALFVLLCIQAKSRMRRHQARLQRIRKVHGPDARIRYMNLRGKRYNWQISIESARRRGQDWIITAWCYEKNEFLVFYASRMYEYFDLNQYQEIKNVPEYFTERYSDKRKAQH